MGPFELMDLIGLDVNYAVTCQIWESYQRHPRFAPSMLQKELVDSGRLGRKSGQGFFEYGVDVEIQAPNTLLNLLLLLLSLLKALKNCPSLY